MSSSDYPGKLYCRDCEKRFEEVRGYFVEFVPPHLNMGELWVGETADTLKPMGKIKNIEITFEKDGPQEVKPEPVCICEESREMTCPAHAGDRDYYTKAEIDAMLKDRG